MLRNAIRFRTNFICFVTVLAEDAIKAALADYKIKQSDTAK